MCLFLKDEDEKLSLEDNIFLEEDYEAGYEAEEDEERDAEEEDEEGEEEEEEAKESTKRKILRLVAEVASKVKEIIGNLITTAGQVVVTILLGLTGKSSLHDVHRLAGIQSSDRAAATLCLCRYHAALSDLSRLLLRLPLPVYLVVPLPDLRHAHLQLHVCLDGHLQCRTPHHPLPLPVPVLPRIHPTQWRLDQVSLSSHTSKPSPNTRAERKLGKKSNSVHCEKPITSFFVLPLMLTCHYWCVRACGLFLEAAILTVTSCISSLSLYVAFKASSQ